MNPNPKKLVRALTTKVCKPDELETIESLEELNQLYALKIREELAEIQASHHKNIYEFVDLMDVAVSFAYVNGFPMHLLVECAREKCDEKGGFGNLALTKLHPKNPSNAIYFEASPEEKINELRSALGELLAYIEIHDVDMQEEEGRQILHLAKEINDKFKR